MILDNVFDIEILLPEPLQFIFYENYPTKVYLNHTTLENLVHYLYYIGHYFDILPKVYFSFSTVKDSNLLEVSFHFKNESDCLEFYQLLESKGY